MNKTCDICGESIKDCVRYDYDRNGNQTGKITCQKCYMIKYRYGSYEKPSKVNKTKSGFRIETSQNWMSSRPMEPMQKKATDWI